MKTIRAIKTTRTIPIRFLSNFPLKRWAGLFGFILAAGFFLGSPGVIHAVDTVPYMTADSIARTPDSLLEEYKQSVDFVRSLGRSLRPTEEYSRERVQEVYQNMKRLRENEQFDMPSRARGDLQILENFAQRWNEQKKRYKKARKKARNDTTRTTWSNNELLRQGDRHIGTPKKNKQHAQRFKEKYADTFLKRRERFAQEHLANQTDNPFLYRLVDYQNRGYVHRPAYLFGVVHTPDERLLGFPYSVNQAFQSADRLLIERKPDKPFYQGKKSVGDSVVQYLSERSGESPYVIRKMLQSGGRGAVEGLANLQVVDPMFRQRGLTMGQWFYNQADSLKKPIHQLDTGTYSSSFLDQPPEKQKKIIDRIFATTTKPSYSTLIDYYTGGNEHQFRSYIQSTYQGRTAQRGTRMARRLVKFLERYGRSDRFFIPIGVAHLVVRRSPSFRQTLREYGFRLKRVSPDESFPSNHRTDEERAELVCSNQIDGRKNALQIVATGVKNCERNKGESCSLQDDDLSMYSDYIERFDIEKTGDKQITLYNVPSCSSKQSLSVTIKNHFQDHESGGSFSF